MPSTRRSAALVALAVAAIPGPGRPESAAFKHEKSIYADDKEAPLRGPEGVACDDTGALVVADTGNGRLLTFEWKDGALSGGAPMRITQLPYPVRVQVDKKGNVLVLDRKAKRIGRIEASGFVGYLDIKGGSGTSTVMPGSFKLDASDGVLVLDAAARRVLALDATGQVEREIALPPGGVFTDIAVDPSARIYALDAVGAVVWAAEKGANKFEQLTKSFKDRVSFPSYIAASRGKLYLVDQYGGGIIVLGQDGSYKGRELSMGATEGLVQYPGQLCINDRGDAIVADRANNRVQVFALTR